MGKSRRISPTSKEREERPRSGPGAACGPSGSKTGTTSIGESCRASSRKPYEADFSAAPERTGAPDTAGAPTSPGLGEAAELGTLGTTARRSFPGEAVATVQEGADGIPGAAVSAKSGLASSRKENDGAIE